jgi:t-SNARE complex subunit (syntaxin)
MLYYHHPRTTVLAEVQDTYEDVRRLEASILELHRMFMDLALLVEQQGETLDVIEFQVCTPVIVYSYMCVRYTSVYAHLTG